MTASIGFFDRRQVAVLVPAEVIRKARILHPFLLPGEEA
jgi:hypothetical protein